MTQSTTFYTIQQITSLLQVSDETVYRHIRSGKLHAIRVGGLWRVSEEALDVFLTGKEWGELTSYSEEKK